MSSTHARTDDDAAARDRRRRDGRDCRHERIPAEDRARIVDRDAGGGCRSLSARYLEQAPTLLPAGKKRCPSGLTSPVR